MSSAGCPWRIAKAVVEGTSHLANGTPCQDFADVKQFESDSGSVLVAVVSDGAGSATHADVGSWLATTTAIEYIKSYFENGGIVESINRDLAVSWLACIRRKMANHAQSRERAFRDYACTLLVAIVGEKASAFIQVGDGAIVISRTHNPCWTHVFWPQHGEFVNTTNFVTLDDSCNVLEFMSMSEQVEELALFTDGIENLVLHRSTRTVHQIFFHKMILPVRKSATTGLSCSLSRDLETYLRSQKISERTDDDKSLILASRLKDHG